MMLIFILVAVISILLVAGWTIICVYRLCFSEEASHPGTGASTTKLFHDKDAVPVGVREIYEQQHYEQAQKEMAEYSYERGSRANLPSAWWENLRQRRN